MIPIKNSSLIDSTAKKCDSFPRNFLMLDMNVIFNCSRTKFVAIIVKVLLFLFHANFSLDRFCVFPLEHSLTSQVTFLRFRSSILSDLYCFHSDVKLVANIKSTTAWQQAGTGSRVGTASSEGSGGPFFESRCSQLILPRKGKYI